jgi:hypothetical protein
MKPIKSQNKIRAHDNAIAEANAESLISPWSDEAPPAAM